MSRHTSPGTALITGGSSGLGAVYADRLARRGYDLVLVARHQRRLDSVAARLRADTGRRVDVIAADLCEPAGLNDVAGVLQQDPRISLLVNNAGMGTHTTLLDSRVDQLAAMIQLNVGALTRLTCAAVPAMVARGRGIVVNLSSTSALAPESLNGVYGGTKAFVLAFTRSLHHELAGSGLQVQAVLPGAVATDFWAGGGLPAEMLPRDILMPADVLVDAALAGLDRRELVTVPSLHRVEAWEAYEQARQCLAWLLNRLSPPLRALGFS